MDLCELTFLAPSLKTDQQNPLNRDFPKFTNKCLMKSNRVPHQIELCTCVVDNLFCHHDKHKHKHTHTHLRVPQVPSCPPKGGLVQGWESVCWGVGGFHDLKKTFRSFNFQSFTLVSRFQSFKFPKSNTKRSDFLNIPFPKKTKFGTFRSLK